MRIYQLAFALLATISILETCFAAPLLIEDFNDGVAQDWTFIDGNQTIADGVLHITSQSWGDDARAVFQGTGMTDYVLDADIQIQNAAGSSWPAAILFRVQDAATGLDNGHYYQLSVGPTLLTFVKVSNSGGSGQWLASANLTLATGELHHVKLIVQGTTATAFIDGEKVISCTGLSDYTSGGVGFKAINSAQIIYDNVSVLSFSADTDNDGLNDATENILSSLGFNWQVNQSALVTTLFSNLGGALTNLNSAGLYTAAQIQALNVATPMIQYNSATKLFTLTIAVEKSVDLIRFDPLPVTVPQATITGDGKIEFQFGVPDKAAFFRVKAK